MIQAYHRLLLRMAGRLPDELITEARRWVAAGELVEVAQAVVFSALAGRVPVAAPDVELLSATLAGAGEDLDALAALDRAEDDSAPPYGLAPVSPAVLAAHGDAVPYSMDLTAGDAGPGAPDAVDGAVVAAVSGDVLAGVPLSGLWRVWRFPARRTQWPPPKRMYLVEAGAGGPGLAAVTVAVQDALVAAGEHDPQVEVFDDPAELPAYQRTALSFAALLWAAAPAEPVRMALVFDAVLPGGAPGFADDHPQLSGDERDRVYDYLDAGVPLLISPAFTDDVVDPGRGAVVPVAFRTDGRWLWPDASAYYLAEHRLAPDPDLLSHIRAAGYEPPEVGAVALHRALAHLYAHTRRQPAVA